MKIRPVLLAAHLLLLVVACSAPVAIDEAEAAVTLGEPDRFYLPRGPLTLTATIYNPGPELLDVGTGIVDGRRLELRGMDDESISARPRRPPAPAPLPPGERVQLSVHLRELFPILRRPGDFTLTVVYPRFRSNTIALKILPSFRADADYRADVQTDRGTITLRFFPEIAPRHVKNFVNLARSGYYDNILFHRIIRNVMIQTGDPTRSGRGGPGYTLRAEFSDRPHVRGTVSMARQLDDTNSAGSQWFICLDRISEWDGLYTVFGEVESGMDVAAAIGRVRVKDEVPQEAVLIKRIIITEGSER